MKLILVVAIAAILMLSCKRKNVPDKVYCQGAVLETIDSTADGEHLSRQLVFQCNGMCPGDKPCEKFSKEYNPPRPNGLVKQEWCGCPGDTIPPQTCDIFLNTYQDSTGQQQRPVCTLPNSCPIPTDTCLLKMREVIDTIKSEGGKDSIYRHKTTYTCECN